MDPRSGVSVYLVVGFLGVVCVCPAAGQKNVGCVALFFVVAFFGVPFVLPSEWAKYMGFVAGVLIPAK